MQAAARTVSLEEKRLAVDLLLNSHTLARNDQLKAFLRYVCEMDIAGKASEISEYVIGVDVLGRPDGYATEEDSAVRSRAHALRRKLLDFYTSERPDAPVRIELPKGSYCPRFVAANPPDEEAIAPPSEPGATRAGSRPFRILGAVAALGLAVAAGYWLGARGPGRIDPVVRDAWGPLLQPGTHVLVSIATPASYFVRPANPNAPPRIWAPLHPSPQILDWYRQRQILREGEELYYQATHNLPLWGEAAGAMSAVRTLTQAGASFEIVPERETGTSLFRERNVLVFGRPEYSQTVRTLLRRAYFQLELGDVTELDPQRPNQFHDILVFHFDPKTNARVNLPRQSGHVHGLITVLPSEGAAGNGHGTVIISGEDSAGTLAAAEFFSSAPDLRQLRDHLKKDGYSSWPSAFQIVVQTSVKDALPLSFAYQTHHVIAR